MVTRAPKAMWVITYVGSGKRVGGSVVLEGMIEITDNGTLVILRDDGSIDHALAPGQWASVGSDR